MTTRKTVVSALVLCLCLSVTFLAATAVAKSTKELKKDYKKPAVTLFESSATQQDDKNLNLAASIQFDSLSSPEVSSLAYQPTHWKPTSYMGNPRHNRCHRRRAC